MRVKWIRNFSLKIFKTLNDINSEYMVGSIS